MAGSYPEILRDQAGNPIPQIWDEANQRWLPYTGEVTLKGQTVTIGGTPYELDPPRTLYGPAGSRPNAAAAHAAVPYAVYVSVDTKVIEMTDGTAWRRWGVV